MTALSIGPNLDIGGVDELLSLLKKPARVKGDVRLSIDNVDKLHCATMQVLCAFVKDRAQAKGRTVIDAPALGRCERAAYTVRVCDPWSRCDAPRTRTPASG